MSISIVQTAHGVVSVSGGTVAFAVPTQANNVVVWMICWPFYSNSFFPSSDDAGNIVASVSGPRSFNGASTVDSLGTVGAEAWFGIIVNPNDLTSYCLPMQTLTLTGPGGRGAVSVWMFELSGMAQQTGSSVMDAQYFTQQTPFINDLNGAAHNPMYSPAGTLYGGVDDPSSGILSPSDSSLEYFIVTCISPTTQVGGVANISSVDSPFTLEPTQNGFACAWKISPSGYNAASDLATFHNGASAFYSAVWVAISSASGSPSTGTIIVEKVTDPTGSSQSFTFNPSWKSTFTLLDGESNTSSSLAPGTYSITEDAVDFWNTVASVDNDDPISAIVLGAGDTVTVTFTNTESSIGLFKLVPGQTFDDYNPATAINSTYCTYGFVDAAKSTQNPLLGFHRKRFSEIQLNINGSGQETTTLFPNYILKNDLTFNPFAYTLPPILLQTDPPDDIVRPVNSVGNRVYVMFSTDAVGARFSLSKTIMVGVIDGWNTVNPNAG